jgi:hypothetical protein
VAVYSISGLDLDCVLDAAKAAHHRVCSSGLEYGDDLQISPLGPYEIKLDRLGSAWGAGPNRPQQLAVEDELHTQDSSVPSG